MSPASADRSRTSESAIADCRPADSYPTDQAVYCPNCGYDLRGIRVDSLCPECGQAPNLPAVMADLEQWCGEAAGHLRGTTRVVVVLAVVSFLGPAASALLGEYELLRIILRLLLLSGVLGVPLLMFSYVVQVKDVLTHERSFAYRNLSSTYKSRVQLARLHCGLSFLLIVWGLVVGSSIAFFIN